MHKQMGLLLLDQVQSPVKSERKGQMKDMNVQNILEALEDALRPEDDADVEEHKMSYAMDVIGQLGICFIEIGGGSDFRADEILAKALLTALDTDQIFFVKSNDKYKIWGKGIYVFAKYFR